MKRWPWILLFALAVGLGLLTSTPDPNDVPIPSIDNAGPQGAKVLHAWLTETGSTVDALHAPLTTLPFGLQALVIAAPTLRQISEEEVEALKRFVDAGGTLVYLSPRPALTQQAMAQWLGLRDAAGRFLDLSPAGADLGGTTVAVEPSQQSLMPAVKSLRVGADTVLDVGLEGALRVAGQTLWAWPQGKGQVWIAAGPDLVENRRLELEGNLAFWAQLRRMRIGFDEFHHVAATPPAWSLNLWAALAQFVVIGLLFVAARSRRLGPARPTPVRQHRSSLEYVHAMGALMQRAGVEAELKLKMRERLRRLMHERLGIPVTLSAEDASRALGLQTGLPAHAYAALDRQLQTACPFVEVSAQAARVENAIVGRRQVLRD